MAWGLGAGGGYKAKVYIQEEGIQEGNRQEGDIQEGVYIHTNGIRGRETKIRPILSTSISVNGPAKGTTWNHLEIPPKGLEHAIELFCDIPNGENQDLKPPRIPICKR
jgi:hypothetical protein